MTTDVTDTFSVQSKTVSRFLMFFTAKLSKAEEFRVIRRANRNHRKGAYAPKSISDTLIEDVCSFNVGGVALVLHWAGEQNWMMVTGEWTINSLRYDLRVQGNRDRFDKDMVLLQMFHEREDPEDS